jgi:hypothetical protein
LSNHVVDKTMFIPDALFFELGFVFPEISHTRKGKVNFS